MERKEILAVSYSGLIGETRAERGKYLKQFHTDFFEQVGKKYGLERGRPRETLTEEEQKEVRHKTAAELEEERLEKIQELKELDKKIEEKNKVVGFGARMSQYWGFGDSAENKQKVQDAEARATKAEQEKATAVAEKLKAQQKATKAVETAKTEVRNEIYDSVQKETIKTILATAKVSFGKDDKGNPLLPTPEQLGKDYGTRFDMAKELDSVKKDGKINSWLVKNLLHAPDRQLWNDMEFGQGQLNYRVIGSYAGIKFNCGFRDLDEATLPKILTNIQALPYDMATAADEGLRETVATVFMTYVSTQAPSGGGGGGSDDNWWKRKDEDWFKGAFNSVFRAVLPQVQGRKRK